MFWKPEERAQHSACSHGPSCSTGPGPATSSPTPPGHIPSGKELSYRLHLLGPFSLTLGCTTLRFPVSPRSMVRLKESRSLWPRSSGWSRCPREAPSRKPMAHDLSPAAPPTVQKHDPQPPSTTRMARWSRVIAGVFAACHSVPNRGIGKDNENDKVVIKIIGNRYLHRVGAQSMFNEQFSYLQMRFREGQ